MQVYLVNCITMIRRSKGTFINNVKNSSNELQQKCITSPKRLQSSYSHAVDSLMKNVIFRVQKFFWLYPASARRNRHDLSSAPAIQTRSLRRKIDVLKQDEDLCRTGQIIFSCEYTMLNLETHFFEKNKHFISRLIYEDNE